MSTATYTRLSLKRVSTDLPGLFFSIVMPVAMYLIFGVMQSWAKTSAGNGNVSAFIMVSMALYGGATAAVAATGSIVVERTAGWGRQLALTPMSGLAQLASYAANVAVRVALPVLAVNLTGLLTVAEMPADIWVGTAVLSVVLAIPYGFYGMIFAQLIRTDSAVGVSATSVVLLAFMSNMFMPLPDFLLPFARWTPLFGANVLGHYPLTEGYLPDAAGGVQGPESLVVGLVATVVWVALFAGICWLLTRREKGRA